jgi:integrase/recombinase XerD
MSFEKFVKERKYLKNVSPRTIEWYHESFKWLGNENPSQDELTDFVVRMRDKGLSAASCNNRIRCVNAYLHWAKMGNETKCGPGCQHLRIPKLKEEQKPVPVYGTSSISKILAFKPCSKDKRPHTLLLLIFDCGLRASECIGLQVSDLDFDNLLISVKGKGNKHRLVPMSEELRKILWKFCGDKTGYVFHTRDGKPLMRRNVLREIKRFCTRLGVPVPRRSVHAGRHTMATEYIKQGGSVVKLQRILGHSSITTTMAYVHLQGQDLIEEHQRLGILGRR